MRLAFTYLVRPYLIPPKHLSAPLGAITQGFGSSNGGPESLFLGPPNLPDAWVYSTRAVDASGHALTAQITRSACPQLAAASGPPPGVNQQVQVSAAAHDALHTCVAHLSARYHGVVTYQPAHRYWLFQGYETALFLAAALALLALCLVLLRRVGG